MSFDGNLSGDDILNVEDIIAANKFSAERLHTDSIHIWDNNISTSVSNADLDIRASGTGFVYAEKLIFNDNDLSTAPPRVDKPTNEFVTQILNVINGIATTPVEFTAWATTIAPDGYAYGDINKSGSITLSDRTQFSRIILDTALPESVNRWYTTVAPSLEQQSWFDDNSQLYTLTSTDDIVLNPGKPEDSSISNGNITVNSTKAMTLPRGEDTYSFSGNVGEIRFNNSDNVFEGISDARVGLGGVYSEDRLTSIVATNSDDIQFFVNGYTDDSVAKIGEVNGKGLKLHGLLVDDILVDTNVIKTTVSNSDLELQRLGAGELVIGNTSFFSNKINNNSTTNLSFANTGFGYIKLNTTGGFVVPVGDNTVGQRGPDPKQGETRWNETDGYLEVYSGTEWINSVGPINSVNAAEMGDISDIWSLILG
jgi:hypothetical protein